VIPELKDLEERFSIVEDEPTSDGTGCGGRGLKRSKI